MGQKVNPIGLRVGIIEDWRSKWFADKDYARFIQEDALIRDVIRTALPRAGVSTIEIERKGIGQAEKCRIVVHTSRPGVVIGRRGQGIDQLKKRLTPVVNGEFTIDVKEIRVPELDARLVAQMVAEQLEARISHRRAMKKAIASTMRAGARGVRIQVAGRLGGSEMSRREWYREGRVPLHTLRAHIDYGFAEAHTKFGRIGVKVWIYLGDVMREASEEAVAAKAADAAAKEEVE